MSEENDSSPKIKVVDRRWFSDDGSLREERPVGAPRPEPEKRPKVEAPAPAPAQEAVAGGEEPAAARATSQSFLDLVATLAQQAQLLLVGAQGFPRQPEAARRLIDYLGVLETKTRGNLSAEEAQLLSNVIFDLRSLFLQAGR